MKRLATSIMAVVLITILLAGTPVYAAERSFGISPAGDRVSILQDIRIDRKVRGDVISIGGDVTINEEVSGDVVSLFGDVTVNAAVNGDMVVIFGNVKLTDKAWVKGDLISIGAIEKNDMSRVGGQDIGINLEILPVTTITMGILMFTFAFFVLLLGLPLIAVFRDRFYSISGQIFNNMVSRTALGFLVFLGLCLFLPLLAVTIIGLLFYFALLVAAEVVTGILFGRFIMRTFSFNSNVFIEFGIGFVIITLLKAVAIISLPQVGIAAFAAVYIFLVLFINSFGLGTLISTKFGASSAR
jgi:hypothetical protein